MVRIGNEVALSSSGGTSDDYGRTREAYEDLEKAINKALVTRANVPFEAEIQIELEE
ncbi:MAG: hypothetical protein WCL49_10605 [bacterium]